MEIFPVLGFEHRQKNIISVPRGLVLIYTPKEGHRRIFVNGSSVFARQMLARKKARLGGLLAKTPVRSGLVPAREMDTANPLEFGGDRKTTGKL